MQALPPRSKHIHTIIILHGRGSTAKEFAAEFVESLNSQNQSLPDIFPGVRWVFPTAPQIPCQRYQGEIWSQWFDMWSTDDVHEREDEQGFEDAVRRVREVVERDVGVVGAERVVLGGISQGCAVWAHVLLRLEEGLGGFVGVCGWLPKGDVLAKEVKEEVLKTAVFLGHAVDDGVIDMKYGEELRDCLKGLGMDVRWGTLV